MENNTKIYESNKVYSEIFGVINAFGPKYINKLPNNLYSFFNERRDKNYNPKYNFSDSLYNQNITKEALSVICMIHLKYWCDEESEKENITRILYENEENKKKNVKNLFENKKDDSLNNINYFNNNDSEKINNIDFKDNKLIKNDSLLERILVKIKKLLWR